MKLLVLTLLFLIAGTHGRFLLSEENAECDGNDQCGKIITPKYDIIGHKGFTEIRQYDNATWAVSAGRSIFGVDAGAIVAAKGLIGYFAGLNQGHEKLPRSIPLVTTVLRKPPPPPPHKNGSHPPHPHDHPQNGSHHHHHPPHPPPPPHGPPLVLVAAYAGPGNPPKPDGRIKLVRTNSTKVYSHEFGGFAISWFVEKEIRHLKADLKELGIKPCKGRFFVATYNGPWKIFGRKNEVWWAEHPKHHHNKTEEAFPEELIGFDQFDPMYLFPEESDVPPQPEDEIRPPVLPGDKPEDFNGSDIAVENGEWVDFEVLDRGVWSTANGRADSDEVVEVA